MKIITLTQKDIITIVKKVILEQKVSVSTDDPSYGGGPILSDNSLEPKLKNQTYLAPEDAKLNKLTTTIDYNGKPMKFYGTVISTIEDEFRKPTPKIDTTNYSWLDDWPKNTTHSLKLDLYVNCILDSSETYASKSYCLKYEIDYIKKILKTNSPYRIDVKTKNGVDVYYLKINCYSYYLNSLSGTQGNLGSGNRKGTLCGTKGSQINMSYFNYKTNKTLINLGENFTDPSIQIKQAKKQYQEYQKKQEEIKKQNNFYKKDNISINADKTKAGDINPVDIEQDGKGNENFSLELD